MVDREHKISMVKGVGGKILLIFMATFLIGMGIIAAVGTVRALSMIRQIGLEG